jgi:flagellar motor switch protein FliN
MSDSLLSATLAEVAARIGDRLPAAFTTDPGQMVLAGDVSGHVMPEDARAVRWSLGEDASLVVAIGADAAEVLCDGPPQRELVEALTLRVQPELAALAVLFDGQAPELGEGEAVEASAALADGPGDPVSIALDDAGTHRITVGLRLIVSDELMAPPGEGVALGAAQADIAPAHSGAAQVIADPVGASGGGQPLEAPSGPQGPGIPLQGLPAADHGPGIPLVDDGEVAAQAATPMPRTAPAGPAGFAADQQMAAAQRARAHAPVGLSNAEAHPADFASFDQLTSLPGRSHSMAMLGEVEMGVTAELGRTRMTVRDVLGLNPGSIIELDRSAGSPVDVVVNGTLIARGEVVVIDEEFGIRITEIIGMAEESSPFPMQVAQ